MVEIPKLQPDILFLDVDMPELIGIELGTRLLETVENKEMEIVFVTAYEQYAIHAFKLNTIHYVLKPVDSQAVAEVMKRMNHKRTIVQPEVSDSGEINVFGHMHIRVNGNEVAFLTAKIEELLALLVLYREKGISKWWIIDVLWEESSMEKSKQNLYTMIFWLKKKLKNAGIRAEINYKNSMYTMNFQEVYCDVIEFDQFIVQELYVNEQNIAKCERVISLYRGDLLEEKDYLWCVNDREKYYQQFFDLVMSVATYYTKKNQRNLLEKLCLHTKPIIMEEDYSLLTSNRSI